MQTSTARFWRMNFKNLLTTTTSSPRDSPSSRMGPQHTSKKAKAWFKEHGMLVLPWPAQSPDLNPIEHLWSHVKRRLAEYEEPPKGMLELWERIEEEWNKIPASVCQGLIESMPRRVEAVYKAKGGHTKY